MKLLQSLLWHSVCKPTGNTRHTRFQDKLVYIVFDHHGQFSCIGTIQSVKLLARGKEKEGGHSRDLVQDRDLWVVFGHDFSKCHTLKTT